MTRLLPAGRHAADALLQGLHPLGQELVLLVAVAEPAAVAVAPRVEGASVGDGQAVRPTGCHAADALLQGLHQLGQALLLVVAVAELAVGAVAKGVQRTALGDGQAVVPAGRHAADADRRERVDQRGHVHLRAISKNPLIRTLGWRRGPTLRTALA